MAALPDAAYASLAPDWVCEVLSPATASFDRVKKLAVYVREAVAHVWFVDPALRTLEVLKLDGARWVLAGSYAGHDVVRAEPFAEIGLELRRGRLRLRRLERAGSSSILGLAKSDLAKAESPRGKCNPSAAQVSQNLQRPRSQHRIEARIPGSSSRGASGS